MPEADARQALICAFDTPEMSVASRLASSLRGRVGTIKLGLEFFTNHGPRGVEAIADESQLPIFLDLKFNDIPNTVAGAVRAAVKLKPKMLTVHVNGGEAMLRTAVDVARDSSLSEDTRPLILGVTVLTSLDEHDTVKLFGAPNKRVEDTVRRWAELAAECGLDGVVCSALEIAAIRSACGHQLKLVVPGLRPPWVTNEDQKRVKSPKEALELGADYLVMGRAITQAPDPVDRVQKILDDIASAHPLRKLA